VALPDVVQQGRPDQIDSVGPPGYHVQRSRESMSLVGADLSEERFLQVRFGQPPPNGIAFAFLEAPGSGDVVETGGEMGPAAGHFSAVA
jgi:hypothetical protein